MKLRLLSTILFFSLVTSCGFNKLFLHPIQIPEDKSEMTLTKDQDTVIVQFAKENHKPTFLTPRKEPVKLDFSIESVVFESDSGNLLNGWMLTPKNAKPNVTLLHLHGNSGFMLSQFHAVEGLLEYGYQIFTFDYSGFGFSKGKATRDNVLLDANAALDYIKTREEVKNKPLVLYGQSLGGHLAGVLAAERQDDIDATVIEGAFSSHKDIAATKAGFIGRILVREKYSAFKALRDYKKPLLIIHSTDDELVPFEMGEKLYQNAREPKSFYEIDECHICGPNFYAKEISEKIMQML